MLAQIKTKREEDKTLRMLKVDDTKKQKLDNWGDEDGDMEEGHQRVKKLLDMVKKLTKQIDTDGKRDEE